MLERDMTGTIAIQQAGRDDASWLEGFGSTPDDDWPRQFDEQDKGTRLIFILLRDGVKAGYAIFNRAPRYALFQRLGMPEIQNLYILPSFRRHGLARALIARCEEQARLEGFSQIGIGVGLHSGFGPAQRLYAGLGYQPDGNGVTYDRTIVAAGERVAVDDNLSLMMVRDL